MPIRNILVPVLPKTDFENQLNAALSLALRVEGHVNAVYIRPDPKAVFSEISELAISAGVTLAKIDDTSREDEKGSHLKFETWRSKRGLPSGIVDHALRTPFAHWTERVGLLETELIRCGRLSDLLVLLRPDPDKVDTERAFDAAVFETARPTILLPAEIPHNLLANVVIAWDGSLQATRAVAGAMSLLHRAECVTIFTAPGQSDLSMGNLDLAEFLVWHGIHARCVTPHGKKELVGNALLRSAAACEATLLVMGGYTHSRVRQMNLGGITSHVLHHAKTPVLMMH